MDNLEELYQTIILEHSKHPENLRAMECPSCSANGDNPFCGDEVTLFLQMKADTIEDLSFVGQGCAISRASASLMTLAMKGQSAPSAQAKLERIVRALTSESEEMPEDAGDLVALLGVRKFPARIKCATLAWHALAAALAKCKEGGTKNSTL